MLNNLNLGCGSRFFTDWINIDFVSSNSFVKQYDLTKGIPIDSDSMDVVYHSHVLEHFAKDAAKEFIKECYRVLKTNGVLRVVVPDLEQIARIYIQQLETVMADPSDINKSNYHWSVFELYDQTVRNYSGGEIGKLWKESHLINEEWIVKRHGHEFINYRHQLNTSINTSVKSKKANFLQFYFKHIKKRILKYVTGEPNIFELIELAKFRKSGEIHQWMYDRFSLSELLLKTGFKKVQIVDAFTSNIVDWQKYKWLDIENEHVRKPDSLFIEAIK